MPLRLAPESTKSPERASPESASGLNPVVDRQAARSGLPRFLAPRSTADDRRPSTDAVAYTDARGTYISPAAESSPVNALIAAHERVHRAQFALGERGMAPASEDVLEAEAHLGAREITRGGTFSPRNAAAPGMALRFDGTSPLAGTLEQFGQQEVSDIGTLRPGRTDDVTSKITAEAREESKTHVADYHYEFETSAKGQRGSIATRTLLDIHYDPNDPRGWITPVSTELKIVQPPEFWKFYPVTISYRRTIRYADEYGRAVDVTVFGQSRLDYPQWEAVLKQHPHLSQLTLADIAQIEADSVSISASITGTGDLTSIVERDYPSMPRTIKDEMLRGAPKIAYDASVNASRTGGGSLREVSITAAQGLMSPDPSFAQQVSTAPGLFVHLEFNAGLQYDAIRAYLQGHDALAVARLEKAIQERLANPGATGPATAAEPDDSVLDDILGWLGDLWSSMPAWMRGTLKAIGKAAVVVGAVLLLAVVIVALAPVELTVLGVALSIGAVLLAAGFLYAIYQRSIESFETGQGNPLTVFLVALGDTVGISAIYEGINNESILSGRSLDLSEEEQYERGVGGVLQLLLLALGLRSRGGGRAPVAAPGRTTTRTPGLYPDAIDPNVAPPGGWTFRDTVTTSGSRTEVVTEVRAPDGTVGSMSRSYNAQTGEFSMNHAFLDQIPAGTRWVETAPPMVPGRGTPLETYMTLRQMRILESAGATFVGPRTVHLSTIINTRTCLQLGAREAALGRPMTAAELDVAILDTHSVHYASNSIIQSGGRIQSAKVSGVGRMKAKDIASADELAAHGMRPDQEVPFGFDIDLIVVPF